MTLIPAPTHRAVDQRPLNGAGDGAWRHELRVPLPGESPARLESLGEPNDRCTWTEVYPDPAGDGWVLAVVRYTAAPRLTDIETGEMTGELAEAWWRVTVVG